MNQHGLTITNIEPYARKRMQPDSVEKAKQMFEQGTPFILCDDGELVLAVETMQQHPDLAATLDSLCGMGSVSRMGIGDRQVIQSIYRITLSNSSSQIIELGDETAALENFTAVISEALRLGATDVHIYLREPLSEICYRIDNSVTEIGRHQPMSYETAKRMLSVAYNWTEGNNSLKGEFNTRTLQPKSFSTEITNSQTGEKQSVSLRMETAPEHVNGHAKCTIRVSTVTRIRDLDELGIAPDIVAISKHVMNLPNGMIIVSGPTGSGKTTFLHGALHYLPDYKICNTIEDPVELVASYNPRISQSNLLPGESYMTQLRSILRQDPDALMIGEIRDEETAAATYRASQTGHLILSTVHTKNSLGCVTRLHDLGLSFAEIGYHGAISLLLACRLVQALCPHCKVQLTENHPHAEIVKSRLGTINGVYVPSAKGCDCCDNGRTGRVSVIEYIVMTANICELISKGDLIGARRYLKDHGWKSLQDKGWELISQGVVSPIDAEAELTDILLDTSADFDYTAHAEKYALRNGKAGEGVR